VRVIVVEGTDGAFSAGADMTESNASYDAGERRFNPSSEAAARVGASPKPTIAAIDGTMIRILAVPGLQRNCHTIEVVGEFGTLKVEITNIPSENPKTGKLTALSIIRSIADAMDPVRVGT